MPLLLLPLLPLLLLSEVAGPLRTALPPCWPLRCSCPPALLLPGAQVGSGGPPPAPPPAVPWHAAAPTSMQEFMHVGGCHIGVAEKCRIGKPGRAISV